MTTPRDDRTETQISWREMLRARIDGLGSSPADVEEIVEELAQHLESAELELRARGLDALAARRALLSQLNDAELVASIRRRAVAKASPPFSIGGERSSAPPRTGVAAVRDWIAESVRDLRFAARSLANERGLASFVVVTLALGIGANAAMFGILDRLLLRGPLHVKDVGQVRRVVSTTNPPGRSPQRTGYLTYTQYEAFRADTQSFAGVAAYNFIANGVVFGRGAEAHPVNRGTATATFFPVLGVRPAVGRFFDEREDDVNDPKNVAVLGHGLWQREFAGKRDIVGTTVWLNHRPFTVIGVAPPGFTGVDLARVDVWFPESGAPHSTNWRTTWNWPWLHVVVRLRPHIAPEQAGTSLTRLHRNGYRGRDSVRAKAVLAAEPVHYTYAGAEATETRVSRWLLGVATIVLLIACANVVNLLLARALKRRRELAVRLTLGAGRMRVIRLLVLEALVLAAIGGAAGIGVAYLFGAAARAVLTDAIEWTAGPVNTRIVVATALISLVTCLAVGVIPAIQGTRTNLSEALKSGSREGGGRTAWFRAALTVTQAALSVILLVAAGLFVRSLQHVRDADLGIETRQVVTFDVERMGIGFQNGDTAALQVERARREAFLPMVVQRLRSWPSIEQVSIAGGVPFDISYDDGIRIPGRDSIPRLPGGGPFVITVSSDYFATVGTRILRGRAFTPEDREGSAPVAVVNETAARTLWPDENALGKCAIVAESTNCAEIVGIAADTKRSSLRDEDAIQVYVPLRQRAFGARERLVVRPRGDAATVLSAVRRELVRLDRTIWYVRAEVLQEEVERQVRPWRLGATIFSLFGALAVLVAAVGLYSVMSYLVTQRRQEIGIRIALGAQAIEVSRLVLSNGMLLAGMGIAIGLGLSAVGARAVAPLLFETSPWDPSVFAIVVLTILAVATLAASIPAWRAGRTDPMEAIRVE